MSGKQRKPPEKEGREGRKVVLRYTGSNGREKMFAVFKKKTTRMQKHHRNKRAGRVQAWINREHRGEPATEERKRIREERVKLTKAVREILHRLTTLGLRRKDKTNNENLLNMYQLRNIRDAMDEYPFVKQQTPPTASSGGTSTRASGTTIIPIDPESPAWTPSTSAAAEKARRNHSAATKAKKAKTRDDASRPHVTTRRQAALQVASSTRPRRRVASYV